jgi:integrase
MSYQRGSIRKSHSGERWILRYRVTAADGRRVENNATIGLVRDFPKERDAWREVDRRGILAAVNAEKKAGRVHFEELAEFYLKAEHGADAVREKSATTIPTVQRYVRHYLIGRWNHAIADDIKPIEIQRWLLSLHKERDLAWTTVSKIRGLMLRTYKIGMRHGIVDKNPVAHTECRSKTEYKAIIVTPSQTFDILEELSPSKLHFTFVLTIAATALRSSEILALRWADILWEAGQISISKRWAKGKDGETKPPLRTAPYRCIRSSLST